MDCNKRFSPSQFFERLAALESFGPIVVTGDGVFLDGGTGLRRVDATDSVDAHGVVALDWPVASLTEGVPR